MTTTGEICFAWVMVAIFRSAVELLSLEDDAGNWSSTSGVNAGRLLERRSTSRLR